MASRQKKLRLQLSSLLEKKRLERKEQRVRDKLRKIARKFRGKFVFVDTAGKVKGPTSRAKGYAYFVDKRGRLERVKQPGDKGLARTHRVQDFDLNRSRHREAASQFNKKWQWEELQGVTKIRPKQNPYESLGKSVNSRIRRLTDSIGSKQPVRVEIVAKLSNGKIVRANVQIGQAQLQPLLSKRKGASKIIQRAAWKALSTELSLEDMVTAGSRKAMRSRSQAKREEWAKADYSTVTIKEIEIKTYYAKGRFR